MVPSALDNNGTSGSLDNAGATSTEGCCDAGYKAWDRLGSGATPTCIGDLA
jgi:hypothetical protein